MNFQTVYAENDLQPIFVGNFILSTFLISLFPLNDDKTLPALYVIVQIIYLTKSSGLLMDCQQFPLFPLMFIVQPQCYIHFIPTSSWKFRTL